MHRALKVLVSCGAVLAAGCGDSSRISAELQNDLALASAGADLELASRPTSETRVVGAVERTTPPARAVANSARAPRPRRSATPQVRANVQQQTEIVREPEVASAEEPMPAPAPLEQVPVEVAASTRPRAIEASSGGVGPGPRGTDWGTIIGIAGTVVLRGGGVGEDRCIPPGAGRGRTPSSINDRYPPRGRGTGRVATGGNMGGNTGGMMGGSRTSGQKVARSAPERPRDVATRPVSSPSPRRAMPSGDPRPTGGTERIGAGTGVVQ
ncbi:hypothetical protein BH23GEM1_BH23GEM1_05250 [soil metagenome]